MEVHAFQLACSGLGGRDTTQMFTGSVGCRFEGMGIQWASTMLGIIAALLVPVPVWFYLKGAKIREKSAYAPTAPKPAASEADESS